MRSSQWHLLVLWNQFMVLVIPRVDRETHTEIHMATRQECQKHSQTCIFFYNIDSQEDCFTRMILWPIFVPFLGLEDVMQYIKALTNYTQQALNDTSNDLSVP